MRDSRRGAEITMQSMPDALGRWHRLLHVWTLLARWYNRKQEVHLVRAGSLLYPELLHQKGPATRSQVREERRLQRIPHGKPTPKEVSKETIWKHSQSIYPWHVVQKDDDRVESLWRSHPWDGKTCKRRPHTYCNRRRNWCISSGSSVMKDSGRAWLNWVALKKYVVRWTNWRTRITHTTLLQKKLVCTATIGGSVRIWWIPTRCR